jgi:hypothetical protein
MIRWIISGMNFRCERASRFDNTCRVLFTIEGRVTTFRANYLWRVSLRGLYFTSLLVLCGPSGRVGDFVTVTKSTLSSLGT